MKQTNKIMISLAALLMCSFLATPSQAGHGLYGRGLYGYGAIGSPYGSGNIPTPPYFALHPPVYYSHPVARPYGQSPFACRCGEQVKLTPAAPKTVFNQHMMPTPAIDIKPLVNDADKSAASGKMILNPFYQDEQQTGRVAQFSKP